MYVILYYKYAICSIIIIHLVVFLFHNKSNTCIRNMLYLTIWCTLKKLLKYSVVYADAAENGYSFNILVHFIEVKTMHRSFVGQWHSYQHVVIVESEKQKKNIFECVEINAVCFVNIFFIYLHVVVFCKSW